jgi:hypothetical protein
MHFKTFFFSLLAIFFLGISTVQAQMLDEHPEHSEEPLDDGELFLELNELMGCQSANAQQLLMINLGNQKRDALLSQCYAQTNNSRWCDQLVRPNPSSIGTFRCTYGTNQVHQLIHPDESTWKNAIAAVQLIKDLEAKGIRACEIYNWWRPEPYNNNVGGAAGRHPFGTSVDVRMCSDREAILAFSELCKYRKQGRIRAIGYYGSSSLHFGVGDHVANTWGKSCPN